MEILTIEIPKWRKWQNLPIHPLKINQYPFHSSSCCIPAMLLFCKSNLIELNSSRRDQQQSLSNMGITWKGSKVDFMDPDSEQSSKTPISPCWLSKQHASCYSFIFTGWWTVMCGWTKEQEILLNFPLAFIPSRIFISSSNVFNFSI